jgi:hypothetical protein
MEEKKQESIYELEIHKVIHLSPFCDVMKVHGGWVYVFYSFSSIKDSQKKDISINNSIFVKDDREN